MRPIKIVMSAFGSYAGIETIEFTDVTHGLFLVTGDTGSGKTTIFDAISYALYDRTSGGKRDGSMMRSQYASGDTETYVDFTFLYCEEHYRIRRNPEYIRRGKRNYADGTPRMTKESAGVELTLPDGTVYQGKKKEIDKKIEEIIGLDASQFTQITMIAQGDFLKLLHAESKERKRIFSKIFQTEFFFKVQEELREKTKELSGELEGNKKDMERELQRVECMEKSEWKDDWRAVSGVGATIRKETISLLSCIVKEGKNEEKQQTERMNCLQEELGHINEFITQGEDTNRLLKAREAAEDTKKMLDKRDVYFKACRKKIEDGKRAEKVSIIYKRYEESKRNQEAAARELEHIGQRVAESKRRAVFVQEKERLIGVQVQEEEPEMQAQIMRIQDMLPRYSRLYDLHKTVDAIREEKEETEKGYRILVEKSEAIQKHEKETIEFLEKESECTLKKERLEVEFVQLCTETESLSNLYERMNKLPEFQKSLEDSYKQLEEQTTSCKAASDGYEALYQAFLKEQAGILAKPLENGHPCPVCGALEHPQKAIVSDMAPEEADVKEAKRHRDSEGDKREQLSTVFQEAKKQVEVETHLITREGERVLGATFYTQDASSIRLLCEHNEKKKKEIEDRLAEYKKTECTLKRMAEKLQEIKLTAENLQKEFRETEESVKKLEISLKQNETKMQLLAEQLTFISKEEAEKELKNRQEGLRQLRERYEKVVADVQACSGELREQLGRQIKVKENGKKEQEETIKFQKQYLEELRTQGFSDEKAYLDNKISIEKVQGFEQELQMYTREVNENNGTLRALWEQTQGKEPINLEDYLEQREEKMDRQKELRTQQMELFGRNTKNREAYEHLKHFMEESGELQEKYELLSGLNKTANGGLSGSIKMDFETYVQRQYFKKIIVAANKRLSKMTSNEFILQCREVKNLGSQGQVGLDLDVYNMLSDATRDVKSLSGGESFMASLSMALGLSDIVQNTAGAIHLDTMFIDEGFGSLDDESRTRAIQILNELAGEKRLVGIISHVNELKEQIERKLVITKTEKGSSAKWVF